MEGLTNELTKGRPLTEMPHYSYTFEFLYLSVIKECHGAGLSARNLRASFVEHARSDFSRSGLIRGRPAADLSAIVLTPSKNLSVGR